MPSCERANAITARMSRLPAEARTGRIAVLRIEGGSKPIEVTKTVPSVAAGAEATATLALDQAPPLDTPVTVVAEVQAVPGEKKKDNNKTEYDAAFFQQ